MKTTIATLAVLFSLMLVTGCASTGGDLRHTPSEGTTGTTSQDRADAAAAAEAAAEADAE